MAAGRRGAPAISIEFDDEVWAEEVERLRPRSFGRVQAAKARKEIEADSSSLPWEPCEDDGPEGTKLGLCVKLRVPVRQEGASAAPNGFVFALRKVDGGLALRMVAFGERHPTNSRTHSVYKRAHRRLHGRYP
jgi:hypothetical protein